MKGIFLVGLLACNISATAADFTEVNVNDFDVAGVKLGMTVSESIDALKNKLGLSDADIEIKEEMIPEIKTVKPRKISVRGDDYRLGVTFHPNILDDGETMVAVVIAFTQPGINAKAMQQAAVDKYGEPTAKNINRMWWCNSAKQSPWGSREVRCETDKGPYLEATGMIKMEDDTYYAKVREHFSSASTPKF